VKKKNLSRKRKKNAFQVIIISLTSSVPFFDVMTERERKNAFLFFMFLVRRHRFDRKGGPDYVILIRNDI
jgi:hypothetical protein